MEESLSSFKMEESQLENEEVVLDFEGRTDNEQKLIEIQLIHKLVSQEQKLKMTRLQSQLFMERKEKMAVQRKCLEFESIFSQMGKGLIEIIEDLISGLLREEEGDGDSDGGNDVEALGRRIPMALNILKDKIQRLDFGKDDKEMLEDLRKMINIFMARKQSQPGKSVEDRPQSIEVEEDLVDDDRQSTPVVDAVRIIKFKSEKDICDDAMADLDQNPGEVPPIQPPANPMEVDSDSDDSDILIIQEIPLQKCLSTTCTCTLLMPQPTTTPDEVTPRIVSVYSVANTPIQGQFTTPATPSQPGSENEQEEGVKEEDADARPQVKIRARQVAMKRTGGYKPRIEKQEEEEEEEHEKCQVRKSPRLYPSPKPTPKMKRTLKVIHAIHSDNPGFKSSAANTLSHVKLLPCTTGGHGPGHQEDSDSTRNSGGEPKTEKASKLSKLKKTRASTPKVPAKSTVKEHYLVDTPRRSSGYHCACGNQFKLKSNLTTHVRQLTEELKFECPICNSSYLFYSGLTTHLKDAHKVVRNHRKNIGCSVCGNIFPSMEKLYQHRSTAHSGTE